MSKNTLYPIRVDIKILVTDGDQDGEVTYQHGLGRLPTEEDVREAITEAMKALPDGFATMTYEECASFVLNEKYGGMVGRVAAPMPENTEWWIKSATSADPI